MIPKVIHYCWFGNKPLPPLAVKCIQSWKKYLPDYEIKKWDESNFDINICAYVKEAYDEKKYAFVSDYARFWIIYNFGGIYFDTDVEVLKPMDNIIAKGPFMGCENAASMHLKIAVNPGLGFGGYKKMDFFKSILDKYQNMSFKNNNRKSPITIVEHTTDLLFKNGLKNTNQIQKVSDIYIYPNSYFAPLDYYTGKINIDTTTYTIHHFAGSWTSKKDKLFIFISRKLGFRFAKFCSSIYKVLK